MSLVAQTLFGGIPASVATTSQQSVRTVYEADAAVPAISRWNILPSASASGDSSVPSDDPSNSTSNNSNNSNNNNNNNDDDDKKDKATPKHPDADSSDTTPSSAIAVPPAGAKPASRRLSERETYELIRQRREAQKALERGSGGRSGNNSASQHSGAHATHAATAAGAGAAAGAAPRHTVGNTTPEQASAAAARALAAAQDAPSQKPAEQQPNNGANAAAGWGQWLWPSSSSSSSSSSSAQQTATKAATSASSPALTESSQGDPSLVSPAAAAAAAAVVPGTRTVTNTTTDATGTTTVTTTTVTVEPSGATTTQTTVRTTLPSGGSSVRKSTVTTHSSSASFGDAADQLLLRLPPPALPLLPSPIATTGLPLPLDGALLPASVTPAARVVDVDAYAHGHGPARYGRLDDDHDGHGHGQHDDASDAHNDDADDEDLTWADAGYDIGPPQLLPCLASVVTAIEGPNRALTPPPSPTLPAGAAGRAAAAANAAADKAVEARVEDVLAELYAELEAYGEELQHELEAPAAATRQHAREQLEHLETDTRTIELAHNVTVALDLAGNISGRSAQSVALTDAALAAAEAAGLPEVPAPGGMVQLTVVSEYPYVRERALPPPFSTPELEAPYQALAISAPPPLRAALSGMRRHFTFASASEATRDDIIVTAVPGRDVYLVELTSLAVGSDELRSFTLTRRVKLVPVDEMPHLSLPPLNSELRALLLAPDVTESERRHRAQPDSGAVRLRRDLAKMRQELNAMHSIHTENNNSSAAAHNVVTDDTDIDTIAGLYADALPLPLLSTPHNTDAGAGSVGRVVFTVATAPIAVPAVAIPPAAAAAESAPGAAAAAAFARDVDLSSFPASQTQSCAGALGGATGNALMAHFAATLAPYASRAPLDAPLSTLLVNPHRVSPGFWCEVTDSSPRFRGSEYAPGAAVGDHTPMELLGAGLRALDVLKSVGALQSQARVVVSVNNIPDYSEDPRYAGEIRRMAAGEGAPPTQTTPMRTFIAGVVSGSLTPALLQPVEVLKVRLQVTPTAALAPLGRRWALGLRALIAEGGLRGMYRGVVPIIAASATSWGFFFLLQALLQPVFTRLFAGKRHAHSNEAEAWQKGGASALLAHVLPGFAAATTASLVTSFATNPLWLVKTRYCLAPPTGASATTAAAAATSAGGAGAGAGAVRGAQFGRVGANSVRGMWDTLKAIRAEEGVRGLFRGAPLGMLLSVQGAFVFSSVNIIRSAFKTDSASEALLATAGGVAMGRLPAMLLSYPFQVIRTRQQDARPEAALRNASVWAHLKHVVRVDGLTAFWRGFTAHFVKGMPQATLVYSITQATFNVMNAVLPVKQNIEH